MVKIMNNKISVTIFVLFILASTYANDFYVNNLKGSDKNPGSQEAPFRTIEKGIQTMKGADTLHLVKTGTPYRRQTDRTFWKLPAGKDNAPTVVDGHGAVLSGKTHYTGDKWQAEGNDIYSIYLKNNYQNFRKNAYWLGFDLVFFDGKPGTNCKSKSELVEFGYYLNANCYLDKKRKVKDPKRNTLYIKLPTGKTPADIKVEAPGFDSGICVGSDFVTVRNLTSTYFSCDGFSGSRNQGMKFENVRGCYNMDQGISHHGSKSTVTNSRFDHNGNCGIVDVYPEARVKYINCMINDNPSRGGVEFHRGKFQMNNCTIKNNDVVQLGVRNNAEVKIDNCLIIGKSKPKNQGINIGGNLVARNCLINNAAVGVWIYPKSHVIIDHCAFEKCPTIYLLRREINQVKLQLSNNIFSVSDKFTIKRNEYSLESLRKSFGEELEQGSRQISDKDLSSILAKNYINIGCREKSSEREQ